MRHVLLALIPLLLLAVGCSDDDSCDGACVVAGAKYNISDRTVHDVDQRTFDAFGEKYTLVRVEFGDTQECDDFDENCYYSLYCGFIVGGEEYPVYGDFVSDEDVLFDEDADLTGLDLPIFDDDDFDDWLWETDSEDDPLIECFEDY
jgi:hypothetical protein